MDNSQQLQSMKLTSYKTNEVLSLFKDYTAANYKDFVIDDTNIQAIKKLAQIVSGDAEKKGLILRGMTGIGKTLLLLMFVKFRKAILKEQKINGTFSDGSPSSRDIKFTFFNPQKMICEFNEIGYDLFSQSLGDVLCLDDVGELAEINNFGTKINLLSEIITARYTKYKFNPELEIYCTTF